MKISRNEAIEITGNIIVNHLPAELRSIKLDSAVAEFNIIDDVEFDENEVLRNYIKISIALFSNKYLEEFLSENLNTSIKIDGLEPTLFPCPCCGYKSLTNRGEYDICMVCYWEDDGTTRDEDDSAANKMTLASAKENFKKYGAVSSSLVRYLDVDRMKQFR